MAILLRWWPCLRSKLKLNHIAQSCAAVLGLLALLEYRILRCPVVSSGVVFLIARLEIVVESLKLVLRQGLHLIASYRA